MNVRRLLPPALSPRQLARAAAALVVGVTVWLATLSLPIAPSADLDASWQWVLNHAWGRDYVFGRDLVYTYGPWGWLGTQYYHPDTFVGRMAWELAFKGLAAALIVALAAALSWPRRVFLIVAALLVLVIFQDTLPLLMIAGLLIWSAQPGRPRPALALTGAFLGFIALQKFTFLVMIAAGCGCISVQLALERAWKNIAWLTGPALLVFLLAWLAAGQPLSALPDFLQHASWVAADYGETMFFDETATVFYCGLATAAGFLALVWDAPRWRRLPLNLALSGFGFIAWKHGFVRADGHVLGFFSAMLFAALAAPGINPTATWRRTAASVVLALLALSGTYLAQPGLFANTHHLLRERMKGNHRELTGLPRFQAALERAAAGLRANKALPQIRARVGTAPADQFGYEQGVLLANQLNYRPRPVFQSFSAYSGRLARLNEAAYLSPAAPAFVLTRIQSIDDRYPSTEDAALFPRLVTDHRLVLAEQGFLLLERRPAAAAFTPQPVAAGRLRYHIEEQPVPAGPHAVWVKIDSPHSWLGWLRSFFYKPPPVTLVVRDSHGAERRFRLVIPAARAGFLLSPMLVETADLERLLRDGQGRSVQSFRVEIAPAHAKFFLKRARYEIFTLPQLPFSPTP